MDDQLKVGGFLKGRFYFSHKGSMSFVLYDQTSVQYLSKFRFYSQNVEKLLQPLRL